MRRFFPALMLCLALSACATQSVVLQNSTTALKQEEMQAFLSKGWVKPKPSMRLKSVAAPAKSPKLKGFKPL